MSCFECKLFANFDRYFLVPKEILGFEYSRIQLTAVRCFTVQSLTVLQLKYR